MVKYVSIIHLVIILSEGILCSLNSYSQCCAGGSGCSIAGGASTGVLREHQVELSTNFQFVNTNKFFKKDNDAPDSARTFDSFQSSYQYFKIGYGVTKNFTFSVEGGYYFLKRETGLHNDPKTTFESTGIGDLILFPRYDILNESTNNHHKEITIGTGFKIPLGSYNDSTENIEPFSGQKYYVTKPTSVQLSSGAHDIIFYAFLYHGWIEQNFNIFANAFYIKKGWNPNGEKLGDYASIALFAGQSFFDKLNIILQARYEWTDKMKINDNILLFGKPSNYYPEATGYSKVFITPQVSYTFDNFSIFAATDFPVYQFLNTSDYYSQVGSKFQTTVGVTYRFLATDNLVNDINSSTIFYCPMHPEIISSQQGQCPKCGMDLELK